MARSRLRRSPFKVAVPRDFAVAVGKYLETWDETDQSPRISITFSIKEEE
jgi:hypothetical protein